MKNLSGLFTRWYQELAGFNFTVIHKKGKENSNADALSRSSHMTEAPTLVEDEYAKFYETNQCLKFTIYSEAWLKLSKNNPRTRYGAK